MLTARAANYEKPTEGFELGMQEIYESIVLARRRKLVPNSESNATPGCVFDELGFLALIPDPG